MNIRLEGFKEFASKYKGLARQVPRATAIALNRTAELMNKGVRDGMQRNFTIREPRFLPPVQLPNADRATEQSMTATITFFDRAKGLPRGRAGGGENLAQRRGAILSKFERGGQKQGGSLGLVAIPTKRLRPNKGGTIPRQLYPVNLRLVVTRRDVDGMAIKTKAQRKLGQGKKLTALGLNGRTYFTKLMKDGNPGIFERVTDRRGYGPARVIPRLVWAFRPAVRLPASLQFYRTTRVVYERNIEREMTASLDRAIRTARLK